MEKIFDTTKADSQGTIIGPMDISRFDLDAYADYEAKHTPYLQRFQDSDCGVAVYRRFRVPEVYSWGCRDYRQSLAWQLAALEKSMAFVSDIPNFLEPWYGIGVVASAFGIPYVWHDGQAPAVNPKYETAKDALEGLEGTVAESIIGRHVFEMIEYFMEQTKGRIPMSLSDTQSPLNIVSSYVMKTSNFMFEMYDNPEDLKLLIEKTAALEADFLQQQATMIEGALAFPGHGFASSRCFTGIGFSDDNMLMISEDAYREFAVQPLCRAAQAIGRPVFHSCGNWSDRAALITKIPGLLMADGAVGPETDPDPNNPEKLGEVFSGTGITLHVRIVGSAEAVSSYVKKIWRPNLKLIVATYCETPEEQAKAYREIHAICQ
jgi:hypothetical protein